MGNSSSGFNKTFSSNHYCRRDKNRPHSVLGLGNDFDRIVCTNCPHHQSPIKGGHPVLFRGMKPRSDNDCSLLSTSHNNSYHPKGGLQLPPIPRSHSFHHVLRSTENGQILAEKGTIRGIEVSRSQLSSPHSKMLKSNSLSQSQSNSSHDNQHEHEHAAKSIADELSAILRNRRCKSEGDLVEEPNLNISLKSKAKLGLLAGNNSSLAVVSNNPAGNSSPTDTPGKLQLDVSSSSLSSTRKGTTNGVAARIQRAKYKAPQPPLSNQLPEHEPINEKITQPNNNNNYSEKTKKEKNHKNKNNDDNYKQSFGSSISKNNLIRKLSDKTFKKSDHPSSLKSLKNGFKINQSQNEKNKNKKDKMKKHFNFGDDINNHTNNDDNELVIPTLARHKLTPSGKELINCKSNNNNNNNNNKNINDKSSGFSQLGDGTNPIGSSCTNNNNSSNNQRNIVFDSSKIINQKNNNNKTSIVSNNNPKNKNKNNITNNNKDSNNDNKKSVNNPVFGADYQYGYACSGHESRNLHLYHNQLRRTSSCNRDTTIYDMNINLNLNHENNNNNNNNNNLTSKSSNFKKYNSKKITGLLPGELDLNPFNLNSSSAPVTDTAAVNKSRTRYSVGNMFNLPLTFDDNFILCRSTPTAGLKADHYRQVMEINKFNAVNNFISCSSSSAKQQQKSNNNKSNNSWFTNNKLYSQQTSRTPSPERKTNNNKNNNKNNNNNNNNNNKAFYKNRQTDIASIFPPPPPPPPEHNLLSTSSKYVVNHENDSPDLTPPLSPSAIQTKLSYRTTSDSANYSDDDQVVEYEEEEEEEIKVILRPQLPPPPMKKGFLDSDLDEQGINRVIIDNDLFDCQPIGVQKPPQRFAQRPCWTPLHDLSTSEEEYDDDDDQDQGINSDHALSEEDQHHHLINQDLQYRTRFTLQNQLRTLIQNGNKMRQRHFYP